MPTESNLTYMLKNEDSAIIFEDIGVKYRIDRENSSGLKEIAIHWLQGKLQYEDFWALKDLSFSIKKGEVFGVIGRNGAGKSTLLKVIARVLHPSSGRIIIQGRIAPLLELGGGFHMELTGMENIYLNGSLLGYSRSEIKEFIPFIIEFSELENFIHSPIRTYSSGMIARLGFAIATCKRPDILLVDEVLSVGDASFQQKCLQQMVKYRDMGTTIILVSHSLLTIQSFCETILWLDDGQKKMLGSVDDVAIAYDKYSQETFQKKNKKVNDDSNKNLFSPYYDVPVDHPNFSYIDLAYRTRKMTGFSDGTFRPDAIVNRQQMTVLALRLRSLVDKVPIVASEQIYLDIPVSHPFARWIEVANKEDLVLTESGTYFWPEQSVTRGQAAKLSLQAIYGNDFKPPVATGKFIDIDKGSDICRWIEFAVNLKIMNPVNINIFGIDDPLTRSEAARMVIEGLKIKGVDLNR